MTAHRSINRRILGLALPSILANITVPFVGIVDLAIAGHLGDAATIGGIAIGTMLFDLLYWNVGFLRVGTGGITAQAYGRRDWKCAADTFVQGIATSMAISFFCLLIQWLYVSVAFLVLDCSPEAAAVAKEYFFIRIWAVPATMSLFVFKGWFIGMQNTVYSMITDIWVNVVNMAASWFLAFHTPLGLKGVAVGTLIAQWTGAALAAWLVARKYRKVVSQADLREAVRWRHIRAFFRINVDLFIRSFSMLVVYNGFTIIATYYGDTQLAVSTVMMKMLLFYSYFVDGFAYAGEALTGRFIGEQDAPLLKKTVRWLFVWCFAIAAVSTLAYAVFPQTMIRLITDDASVIEGCGPYLFWLILMPVVSCIAFTWDGIYIGATASRALRNCTIGSALAFLAAYFLCAPRFGVQSIYIAYFVHLLWRSLYQTVFARRHVFSRIAVLLLLLLMPVSLEAQDDFSLFRSSAGNASVLYRGRRVLDYTFPFNGTYYWSSPDFAPGTVCYNGKVYACSQMNIDAAQQELIVRSEDDSLPVLLNRDYVKRFTLDGRKYVNGRLFFGNPDFPEGFFEVLYEGRAMALMQVEKTLDKVGNPEMVDTGTPGVPVLANVFEVFKRKVTCYHVAEDGTLTRIVRRSDIYNIYRQHRRELRAAIAREEPDEIILPMEEVVRIVVELGEGMR